MKKFTHFHRLIAAAAALVCALPLAACSGKNDSKTIIVGASPSPHAKILAAAKPLLEEKGYTLEIREFTDYVIPNEALESGELTANFFQHQPYLTDFNAKKGTHLVSVASIHFEPLGIYAGKSTSLENIPQNAKISVPNDTTNEARALQLLESKGIIKLKNNVGLEATPRDIVENPYNIEIVEMEAAQVPRTLSDVDFGIANGNYASLGNITDKRLAAEDQNSDELKQFANIVAVKEGHEKDPGVVALVEALTSDTIRTFINESCGDVAVAVF